MTTISITVDTLDVPGQDYTWATALDAIAWCSPAMQSLSVHSASSGDVDAFKNGYRVRVAVRGNASNAAPQSVLDEAWRERDAAAVELRATYDRHAARGSSRTNAVERTEQRDATRRLVRSVETLIATGHYTEANEELYDF